MPWLVVLMLLLMPASAQAVLIDYLTLPGVTGSGPSGSIRLDFFEVDSTNGFLVLKEPDAATPFLFALSGHGSSLPFARIDRFDSAIPSTGPVEELQFDRAFITSFDLVLEGDRVIERIGFASSGPRVVVPEPGVLALIGLAGAFWGVRRFRGQGSTRSK